MTNTTFETRRFFKKISVELLKDIVRVRKSNLFNSIEYELSYENIETKRTVESKVNSGLLVISMFFGITALLYFLSGNMEVSQILFLIGFVIICIAFVTKLKIVSIKCYDGQNIELYFTDNNKEDVLNFADTIINSCNHFILEKYSKIDKDLPIENQLTNLDFLRNKNLISEEKYEQLKNVLLGRENKKSIGYM